MIKAIEIIYSSRIYTVLDCCFSKVLKDFNMYLESIDGASKLLSIAQMSNSFKKTSRVNPPEYMSNCKCILVHWKLQQIYQ